MSVVGFAFFVTFVAYPPEFSSSAFPGWTNISGVEDERGGASRRDLPAERAEALLRKMENSRLEIQPGAHTYNHILDCVSFLRRENVIPVATILQLTPHFFPSKPTLCIVMQVGEK